MIHFFRALKPLVVDFLSTIVFVAIYAITGDVTIGIVLGIAAGIVQFGWLLARKKPIALMQWASLALVIVLGSASLVTADPRFVMIKPSIGAFAIACVMLKRGWQMRYFPPIVVENVAPGLLVFWGYAWSALYFLLAIVNLVVAFRFGLHAWAWFTGTVPVAAPLLLFVAQFATLRIVVGRRVRAQRRAAGQEDLSAA
jgi:intracellular septation protein